jgi:hypothetical protein
MCSYPRVPPGGAHQVGKNAAQWQRVIGENYKNILICRPISLFFEFPRLENLFQRGGFIAFRLRTVVTMWGIQI